MATVRASETEGLGEGRGAMADRKAKEAFRPGGRKAGVDLPLVPLRASIRPSPPQAPPSRWLTSPRHRPSDRRPLRLPFDTDHSTVLK